MPMTNADRSHVESARGTRTGVVMLALIVATSVPVWGAPPGALNVQAGPTGEVGLQAHGAPIDQVLQALATATGFEYAIEDGPKRPAVTATVPMAPLDVVLRRILHERNYALLYDRNGKPSQVILLAPSGPRRSSARTRVARPRRGGTRRKGPTVVRTR
jgi:hypothetical protein